MNQIVRQLICIKLLGCPNYSAYGSPIIKVTTPIPTQNLVNTEYIHSDIHFRINLMKIDRKDCTELLVSQRDRSIIYQKQYIDLISSWKGFVRKLELT